MSTDYFYKFRFCSSGSSHVASMEYYVETQSIDDLKLFFKQHNFTNVPDEAIQVITTDHESITSSRILQPFEMRSNNSNEIFTIMTCQDFIDYTIDAVAQELAYHSIFGEAIIRRDIEIFKLIGDLLYELPHAEVADFCLVDDDLIDKDFPTSRDIFEMRKDYCESIGREYGNAYYAYETLYESLSSDDILPITIEAYVSHFIEMITDSQE